MDHIRQPELTRKPSEKRVNGVQIIGVEMLPQPHADAPDGIANHSLHFAAATDGGIYTTIFMT